MPHKRIKLDKIDRRILRDLQINGRMTNVDLAKNAGISAPPCLRRVRALEDSGIIQSYHAYVDPASVGFGITVYVMVSLSSHAETNLTAFNKRCEEWDMVRECHMISGETDFLLRVVARDWDTYQQFLTEELHNAEGVASMKTMPLVRTTKYQPGVPISVD